MVKLFQRKLLRAAKKNKNLGVIKNLKNSKGL